MAANSDTLVTLDNEPATMHVANGTDTLDGPANKTVQEPQGAASGQTTDKFAGCTVLEVNVDGSSSEESSVVSERVVQSSEVDVPIGRSVRHAEYVTFAARCSGNWQYCADSMEQAIHSGFILPMHFVCLTAAVSALIMGSSNLMSCPMAHSAPIILFIMGIFGIIGTIGQIFVICKSCCFGQTIARSMDCMNVICYFTLVFFLMAEMIAFMTSEPSYDPESDSFCEPNFYVYTYWMNYFTLALLLLIGCLHIPTCMRHELYLHPVREEPYRSL